MTAKVLGDVSNKNYKKQSNNKMLSNGAGLDRMQWKYNVVNE